MWPFSKESRRAELARDTLESLALLVQAAREDAELRTKLELLVHLSSFQRKSAINTAVAAMRLKGEPPEIIAAFALLADDACAAQLGHSLVED